MTPVTYTSSELFTDLFAALPTYFQSDEETFSRVYALKLDDAGEARLLKNGDPDERWFVEHKETGQLHIDEPAYILAVKCAAIFIVTPLYTVGHVAWNCYQMVRCIIAVSYNAFHALRADVGMERFFDAMRAFNEEINPLPNLLMERLFAILKSPLYGVALGLAALSGIIRPLQGRHCVALIEKAWHHGASYKDNVWKDIEAQGEQSCDSLSGCMTACQAISRAVHMGNEFFLALCFLERGNRENVRVLEEAPLRPFFDGV
jgi:hypothetical protein